MKNDKTLWGSISILIGVVIAIMALGREPFQIWLLVGVFVCWGVWIVSILLFPYMQDAKRRKKRQQQIKQQQALGIARPAMFEFPNGCGQPMEQLLLWHVNHRISAYLQAAYPNVTWEWCEKNPEKLVIQGGVGRIRVFGLPDFDHADITVDKNAGITCDMIKIVPLSALGSQSYSGETLPPNKQPVDPQIWYELCGHKVLESVIADLNSRGHSTLTLHEDGDICVKQEQQDVTKEHLSGFPEKVYWDRLVQVFERNGLAAEITAQGIQLTW